jgi:hypothetical protein
MVQKALRAGRQGNILQQIRDRYRIRGKGYNIPLQAKGSKKLDSFLQAFKRRIDRPPVNASLKLDANDEVSILAGKAGAVVDTEKLRHNLLVTATQLDRDITASVEVQEPDVTASELRSWGISSVVARFDSRYKTADANRTHNLKVAAQALDGAVIPPGATFSFNKQVGPRASNNGYKEAPVVVDGELRTRAPHIWAAGDAVACAYNYTSVATHHAEVVVENLLDGAHRKAEQRVVPWAIYTDPSVGHVGLTEAEARTQGYDVRAVVIPASAFPRAQTDEETYGLVKMVADARTNRALGANLLCLHAGDIIHEVALALQADVSLDHLADLIHAYPTMSQAVQSLARRARAG